MNKTIFVIVVTYNGRKWYNRCFDSLRKAAIHVHTVVIDNASSDDTVAFIEENYPEIHVIENQRNLGFGRANNIGIKHALEHGADYVYLLNQDAWIRPDTIKTLIEVRERNQEYGVISPMQTNAEENKLDKNFIAVCSPPQCDNLINDMYFKNIKEIYETQFVMAAHWLITRECLLDTGGFSPVFKHYGEDNNFIHRARFHGYKTGICPLTCAVHDREFRVESKQKTIYLAFVQVLVSLSDINNVQGMKTTIRHLVRLLFYVIKYKSLLPLYYLIKLAASLPGVIRNNRITKTKKANYIES